MSDYGELVRQMRTEASHLGGIRWHRTAGLFTEAARAIESLLAEKASARDEAMEEAYRAIELAQEVQPAANHPDYLNGRIVGFGRALIAVDALRSPAKEKADD